MLPARLCAFFLAALAAVATAQAPAPPSGDALCIACHDAREKKPVLSYYLTRHGAAAQPGCQACHGSSRAHVRHADDDSDRPPPDYVFGGKAATPADEQAKVCLNCHRNDKSGKRAHWVGSSHAVAGVACSNCHEVHARADKALDRARQLEVCAACHKRERAEAHYLSAHPIASGRTACGDCHNPHGSAGPKLLVKHSVNETCVGCHADKRGPHLWEHPPVVDDCSHCHRPHGSAIASLLKSRPPWLCQGCHAGTVHTTPALSGRQLPPAAGGTAPSPQLLLRACVNCHSAIHGSNHPSGVRFTR